MMSQPQPFLYRPPSSSWEVVRLAQHPDFYFWIWVKPQTSPGTLVLKFAAELAAHSLVGSLSLGHVLQAAGMSPGEFSAVVINSVPQDAQLGNAPIFQHPIPLELLNGGEIHLRAAMAQPMGLAQQMPPGQPMAMPQTGMYPPMGNAAMPAAAPPAGGGMASQEVLQLCNRIESDWQSIVHIERQLAQLRKQLASAQGRIDALNRDLRPEERRNADRQDISDWQDARRWLRDSSTKLARYIKEHDIGVTSMAGKKQWFEDTYNQYVAPRQPWDQLPMAQREFETHRKIITTLLNNMHNAQQSAGQDGENRAKQILARIRAKSSRRK